MVTREVHASVVFEAVDKIICSAQDHFIFLTVLIISMTFVIVVGIFIFVCDVEHTSFHFGMYGRKFVLCCLVSVHISELYVIAGSSQEL